MSDTHRNFLADCGYLLREDALAAKAAHVKARGTDDAAYEAGRAMAYYEVITLLIAQAEAFGLPVEDLRLDGLDPDRELL